PAARRRGAQRGPRQVSPQQAPRTRLESMTRFTLHLATFLLFLSLWTWKLLEPHPVPEELRESLAKAGLSFAAAKTLHASGYAFLTILAVTLPVQPIWRRLLVAFLLLHGVGTEIGQTFVPNRTGRVLDVAIDWFGIAMGLGAVRICRRNSTRDGQ